MTTATATKYSKTFHGRADQVSRVRHEVAKQLDGCPVADDAVLIVSEIATNAVLHSQSRGEFFTVRVELSSDHVRIEVEDLGGAWRAKRDDGRPHGLDVVEALTGPDGWGVERTDDGDRIVWARLDIPS